MTSTGDLALDAFHEQVDARIGALADQFHYINPLGGTIEHLTMGLAQPTPSVAAVTVTLHADDATTWTTDDGKPADLATAARILGVHAVPARGILAAIAEGLTAARAAMLAETAAADEVAPDRARDYWRTAGIDIVGSEEEESFRVLYAIDALGLDGDHADELIEERGAAYLIQHGPWENHEGILPSDLLQRARAHADRADKHVDEIIRAAVEEYLY